MVCEFWALYMNSTQKDHAKVQAGNQYLGWMTVMRHVEMGAPIMIPMLK